MNGGNLQEAPAQILVIKENDSCVGKKKLGLGGGAQGGVCKRECGRGGDWQEIVN